MVGYGIDNALAALPDADATTDELRALRAEVHRLRAERDLLKKAAAYFASPPS
jgi:transposase-like protein